MVSMLPNPNSLQDLTSTLALGLASLECAAQFGAKFPFNWLETNWLPPCSSPHMASLLPVSFLRIAFFATVTGG